jgi:hypothetical protein
MTKSKIDTALETVDTMIRDREGVVNGGGQVVDPASGQPLTREAAVLQLQVLREVKGLLAG